MTTGKKAEVHQEISGKSHKKSLVCPGALKQDVQTYSISQLQNADSRKSIKNQCCTRWQKYLM